MGPDDLKRLFSRRLKNDDPTPGSEEGPQHSAFPQGPTDTTAATVMLPPRSPSPIAQSPMPRAATPPSVSRPVPMTATSTEETILTQSGQAGGAPRKTIAPIMGSADTHDLKEKLGSGGMGTVYRVKDKDLNRSLAMKVIHTHLLKHGETLSRFTEEAQLTSQLEHPAIVPVHAMGYLPDGRVYFTMKEIKGRTFTQVIGALHKAKSYDRWEETPDGWTFYKVIDSFLRSVEAIAYAHNRGVIHRDLKPSNIMVGEFGEVLVVDWGLAKIWGEPEDHPEDQEIPDIASQWRASGGETLYGSIAGTPAYMAPEQVKGETDRMSPPTDVYALGSMLYHILEGGPPFKGKQAMAIMRRVVEEAPPPFDDDTQRRVPKPLRDLAMWCLKKEPEDRPKDAGVVVDELKAFLAGAKQREMAKERVAEADAILPKVQSLRQEAEGLRSDAAQLLMDIEASDPAELKRPAWAKEDRATALEKEATTLEVDYIQCLSGALSLDGSLQEAHRRLAAFYVDAHRRAELRQDFNRAVEYAALIQAHDTRGRYQGYLEGEGLVTLTTDPPQAEVMVFRYETRDRQAVLMQTPISQMTPLSRVDLPMGSYRLEIRYPGRSLVHYPLKVNRQETIILRRPGTPDAFPIPIPPLNAVGPQVAYVAPGYFECGGDRDAPGAMPKQRVWVDAFALSRRPVTNGDYLKFLNDLVSMGQFEQAIRHAPRVRGARAGDRTALYYGMRATQGFTLDEGAHPTLAHPDAPVCGVSFIDAMAYAGWLAGQTGHSWRLPGELEIEKAARGADGRPYPWGHFADPSWGCCFDSHTGEARPATVSEFPADLSPYGVLGLAGNMATWCLDKWHPQGPAMEEGRYELPGFFNADAARRMGDGAPKRRESLERVIRGGAWNQGMERMRVAGRDRLLPEGVSDSVGIRLAYSID